MKTFNVSDNNEREVKARAKYSTSAYNRADGVLKFANGQGYVNQGEIRAAVYALNLSAEPGDVIQNGRMSYTVVSVDSDTITMRASSCPHYRDTAEYTVRWRMRGEPRPARVAACEVSSEKVSVPEPSVSWVEVPRADPQPQPNPNTANGVAGLIDQLVAAQVAERVAIVESEIRNEYAAQATATAAEIERLTEQLEDAKKNGGGGFFRVQVNDGPVRRVEGREHKLFRSVLKKAARRKPVYIMGPAGTGKTFMVGQVAEALGLPKYVVGSLLQAHEIFGYMDANGKYVPTSFYKAFTGGGVFCLDEFDGSSEEVVLKMNSIVANRECTFPNSEQAVEAHPDFVIIATGNTAMTGPDNRYVARTEMDSSSANRWIFKYADYDTDLERAEIKDDALVDFAIEMRKLLEKQSVNMDFTIRDMYTIKEEIEDGETIEEGMAASIGRKLGRMRAKQLASAMCMPGNKYATAFKNMADELEQ